MAGSSAHRTVTAVWYGRHPLGILLAPLSWLFCFLVGLRRLVYAVGPARVQRLPVPVIVVGNITAGGAGKTPLVIWIARFLKAQGYNPAMVTRGYGGRARQWPQQVRQDSDPDTVGDEAVLLARRDICPVAAGPDRVDASRALIQFTGCDIIVSDDGLQHLALGRDVEIAVLDSIRRLGNGRCLPAGPLREPASRLKKVDLVVAYGRGRRGEFSMQYLPGSPRRVGDGKEQTLAAFSHQTVHAVAGLGDPKRFFAQLRGLGLQIIEHEFADHHRYVATDLDFGDELPVLMTEKDAVKCQHFATPNWWYLPVEATLPEAFGQRLLSLLQRKPHGQEAA